MAINIGPIDFSGLADLPSIFEAQRLKGLQQSILSTLDPSSPKSIEEHATRLMAAGDIAGGQQLIQDALQRRELARKIAYDQQYLQQLPGLMAAMKGAPVPGAVTPGAPGATPGFDLFTNPTAIPAPTAPTPGPSPFNAAPGALPPSGFGPRSELPPQLGRPEAGIASLRSNMQPSQDLTPSESIIAAAQGGLPPPPQAGPPTAQLGPPTVGAPPEPAPSPGLPAWALPAANVPLDAGVKTPSLPEGPVVTGLAPEQAAQKEASYWSNVALGIAPNNHAALTMVRAKLADALARAKIDPERKDWALEQIDNRMAGVDPTTGQPLRPFQNFSDWKKEGNVQTQTYESAMKVYNESTAAARNANPTLTVVRTLRNLVENPNLLQGPGASEIGKGLGYVQSFRDALVHAGVPIPDSLNQLVDNATSPVKLQNAFEGLTRTFTLSRLGGSLKQGISEGDRLFITGAGPNIENVQGGNKLLLDFYEGVAKQQIEMGKIADKLLQEKKGRLSPADINLAVQKYVDDNPVAFDANGKPVNELGRKLQALQEPQLSKATEQAIGVGKQAVDIGKSAAESAIGAIAPVPGAVGQAIASGAQSAVNAVPAAVNAIAGSFAPAQAPFSAPAPPPGPGVTLPGPVGGAISRGVNAGVNAIGAGLNRLSTSPTNLPQPVQDRIQSLGESPSGVFDPTSFSGRYNDLSSKEKALTFGSAKPGSIRESLDAITKGDTLDVLRRAVPPEVIGNALGNTAQTASLAAWARALDIMRRTSGARPAVARFKMATDNLRNNIGGDFTYTDFIGGGQ